MNENVAMVSDRAPLFHMRATDVQLLAVSFARYKAQIVHVETAYSQGKRV